MYILLKKVFIIFKINKSSIFWACICFLLGLYAPVLIFPEEAALKPYVWDPEIEMEIKYINMNNPAALHCWYNLDRNISQKSFLLTSFDNAIDAKTYIDFSNVTSRYISSKNWLDQVRIAMLGLNKKEISFIASILKISIKQRVMKDIATDCSLTKG